MVGGSVESGCNKLSENIRFVSSKRSYSGENVRYRVSFSLGLPLKFQNTEKLI